MNIKKKAISSMLLWWTLDSVPLVINPKIVQWRSEDRAESASAKLCQSNRTDKRIELTSLMLNGPFIRRATDLEKPANMN